MNTINTITIDVEEYAGLIRRSALLDVILSCKVDKAYPSETEKEVLRIKELIGPSALTISAPEEEGEGDDA